MQREEFALRGGYFSGYIAPDPGEDVAGEDDGQDGGEWAALWGAGGEDERVGDFAVYSIAGGWVVEEVCDPPDVRVWDAFVSEVS